MRPPRVPGNMTRFFDGTRRGFLHMGIASIACIATSPALAMTRVASPRTLSFHNLHTDERLHVAYWKDGRYDRAAMGKINHILRDHYSGDTYPMDLRLMDMLYDLQHRVRNDGTVEIVSGYRSPKTNMMLSNNSDGVAKRSYHTKGMAIDIRMPGTALPQLHNAALFMRRGGVGYYPDSQFVHVDVGPVRTW